jgi:transposase
VGQFCIYKNKPKGRRDLTAKGDNAGKRRLSWTSAEREKEPWLLATCLKRCSSRFAKKIVKIYRTRMQIEESFRDLKTGLSFNESKTRTLHYLSVLLLLTMLAQYVLFILGMLMKLSQHHLQYQANSVKNSPVLSYQFIGLRAFRDRRLRIKNREWQAAYQQIQILMRQPLNV